MMHTRRGLRNFYREFVAVLSLPIILDEYFQRETGEEYGIGVWAKASLALKMARNRRRIVTSSFFLEHLFIATKIMKIPKSVKGCVVECGAFKGGSAANLSLICRLCNREFEVFDSFSGLPASSVSDEVHTLLDREQVTTYGAGAYSSSLDEVRRNVSRYGNIAICHFHPGYFEDTLPNFKKVCVLAFVDADLRQSIETCVKNLWPLLTDESYLFVHEAHHMEIAQLFFDKEWWDRNLSSQAPGLIGAGNGLGLYPMIGAFGSDLGYVVKNPNISSFVKKNPVREVYGPHAPANFHLFVTGP